MIWIRKAESRCRKKPRLWPQCWQKTFDMRCNSVKDIDVVCEHLVLATSEAWKYIFMPMWLGQFQISTVMRLQLFLLLENKLKRHKLFRQYTSWEFKLDRKLSRTNHRASAYEFYTDTKSNNMHNFKASTLPTTYEIWNLAYAAKQGSRDSC